ncbi:MAG: hypothetical protein LBN71_04050 [Tannerella sp.]|jgi:hypothetical protein|nr:hypothetical protein [Tannerella sp.]
MSKIPLVIGITGHRNIPAEYIAPLREKVRELLLRLQADYPHSEIIVLSALAKGADTLCAEVALETGCTLIASLPMEAEEYRKDFAGTDRNVFNRLAGSAKCCFPVPLTDAKPNDAPRDYFYRQLGRYLTSHCHLLLALWDGDERVILPGGTADVVRMALDGFSGNAKDILDKAAVLHPVLQLVTPKNDANLPENPLAFRFMQPSRETGYVSGFEGLPVFEDIEKFNLDVSANATYIKQNEAACISGCLGDSALPEDNTSQSLAGAFAASDALALLYQRKRNTVIGSLSFVALGLVLSFLLYDEAESVTALVVYGGLLVAAWLIYRRVEKGKWHERYLLYRALAETLRVQLYMRVAGMEFQPEIPAWRRERTLTFIQGATLPFAVTLPQFSGNRQSVEAYWIEGQLAYHQSSISKKGGRHRLNIAMTQWLMLVAVAFYLVVLACETAFPNVVMDAVIIDLSKTPLPAKALLTVSGLFKIILGTLFAGIAFLSNYYGKQALPEQMDNDDKMQRLFSLAKQEITGSNGKPASKQLVLRSLASAHVEETLSWYIYNSNNAPELLIG